MEYVLYTGDIMSEENTQGTVTEESLGVVQEEIVSTELNPEVLDIAPSTEVEGATEAPTDSH